MFQGENMEIERDIYNFDEGEEEEKNEEGETESPGNTRRKRLCSVGSLKILSGLWVYSFFDSKADIVGFGFSESLQINTYL